MRLAYADPPYVGQARKHYKSEEVDHVALIKQLQGYDGWALSASSPSLHYLLPLCPANVRVAAWVKPFCSFKPHVNPAYAWEPVIFVPARDGRRDIPTIRDFLAVNITLRKGLAGAKPLTFCHWIFNLLGADAKDDTLDDLFPGTGIVTIAWNQWQMI